MRFLFSLLSVFLMPVGVLMADESLPTFIDMTNSSGITFKHSYGDKKLDNIVEGTGAGVCIFDFDGDGFQDIYFVTGKWTKGVSSNRGMSLKGALSNRLYRNKGRWQFEDVTEKFSVGAPSAFTTGCSAADYDNDGDTDLYLLNYGENILFRNDGSKFTNVSKKAGLADSSWSLSAVFFDYDQDGDLDVYVGNYLLYDDGKFRDFYPAKGYPGPLSYQGQADHFYENQGDGTFRKRTKELGLFSPQGRTMSVSASDLNDDGLLDLYVANDAMENYYFEQTKEHSFQNKAVKRGLAFSEYGQGVSSMGPAIGDINRDGRFDVFIPDLRYNTLLLAGETMYEDVTRAFGVSEIMGQYSGWAGVLLDYDHDGWLDIFTTHGHAHFEFVQEDTLLRNINGTRFEDVSKTSGPYFEQKYVGRGAASGDLDNDGDVDLVVVNLGDRPRLLKNDGGNSKSWIYIQPTLKLAKGNRPAIGAKITIKTSDGMQVKELVPTQGYLSQHEARLHFGLGNEKKIEEIIFRWPDGRTSKLRDIPVNQRLEISDPEKSTARQ